MKKLRLVYSGKKEYERDFNIQMLDEYKHDVTDIEITDDELKFIDNIRKIYINGELYHLDTYSIFDIITKTYVLKIISDKEYNEDSDIEDLKLDNVEWI